LAAFFDRKGKLANIGKVSEFFASLGIPLPTFNAYFHFRTREIFNRCCVKLGIDKTHSETTAGHEFGQNPDHDWMNLRQVALMRAY
jgi:hypothetical protein